MECFRCKKTGEEVKLLDVISGDEIVKACEECSFVENIPVIERPTASQLKESERPYSVKERLRRMAGLYDKEKEEITQIAKKVTDITLNDLWRRKKQKELEERYELEKAKYKPLKLVDDYNWHVLMARRKKKLTRKQVAELLGESETAIKMIESKEVPGDALGLINKLEQFFGIKLKQEEEREIDKIRKPVKKVNEEKIEAPEKIEIGIEEGKEKEKKPARILKFDAGSLKNITIGDLQRMKEKKKEKEKLEKQRKMEIVDLMGEVEKEEKEREERRWKEEADRSLVGDDIELE